MGCGSGYSLFRGAKPNPKISPEKSLKNNRSTRTPFSCGLNTTFSLSGYCVAKKQQQSNGSKIQPFLLAQAVGENHFCRARSSLVIASAKNGQQPLFVSLHLHELGENNLWSGVVERGHCLCNTWAKTIFRFDSCSTSVRLGILLDFYLT